MGNKGSAFERDISKYLSKWLTGEERPYQFWRSPASGMLGTVYRENEDLKGDIIPIDKEVKTWWPVVIECKNGYPKTSFHQHFQDVKFGIKDFWLQTVNEIPKDKLPMLIYRKKGRKIIIGIDKYTQKKLNKKLTNLNSIIVKWSKKSKIKECFLYNMEDFFNNIKPEDIKGLL